MKRIAILVLTAFAVSLSCKASPAGGASAANASADDVSSTFIEQLQPRDSILIADQLRYGVLLPSTPFGTGIELPALKDTLSATLMVVQPWVIDTMKVRKKEKVNDLKIWMTVTSFDEGEYILPDIPVALHRPDGSSDTLSFKGQDVLFCTMPVDTATFKVHDIKGQMRYPVTFIELLPWIGGVLALAALVAGIIYYVRRRRRLAAEAEHRDPPHIVALRKLDNFRGDKYWAPSKQKAFYSGVTDALREYIDARYSVGAMEMTTTEIFDALKDSDVPEDLMKPLKEMFVRSDYVKFAKYVASEQENAGVLPLSVRFVTATYQEEIKDENVL